MEEKTTGGKILYTKYGGKNKRFFRGELIHVSRHEFTMLISEQKRSEKTVVETKSQSRIKEIDSLRPAKSIKTAVEKAKVQKLIDEYLKENQCTVLDAIKEIELTEKVGKKNVVKRVRKIEHEIEYEVEYYLKEERVHEEIEIERLAEDVSWKIIDSVPMYTRLQAFQFRKAFHNYLNNQIK